MAYVSVLDWRPEQVTEWLKGLENCLSPYLLCFSNNQVNGQQLLNLCPDDLTHLGVVKIGHQELILEAVQELRNFHYELDRENLQSVALRVSCASHSLHNQIRDVSDDSGVTTQIMSDVSNVISKVKTLVSWLDRAPFSGNMEYVELKPQLLSHCMNMAVSAQRGRFAESPITTIRDCSCRLAKLSDSIIQDSTDPMILQPAFLDLATLKKKAGEDLGFFLVPSFHGEHLVGDMKLSSPAHQSGKIQPGDEVVQVNYQTVVGWARKKVVVLIEESPNDLLLTLKRRPQHVKMYGQVYMKPYRLPSRKRAAPYSRWNENLPSPRPEFLTIPRFDIPIRAPVETKPSPLEDSVTSSSSDEEFPLTHSASPTSMRLYLPKPRAPLQRRFTLSGPPRPSAQSDQFWRDLQKERSWRSNQNNSQIDGDKDVVAGMPTREKSASVSIAIVSKLNENSAAYDAKSIIELNKVKRDAFFSNMGGPSKPAPPRGRLDKSRSTPAYDLGEVDPKDPPQIKTPARRSHINKTEQGPSNSPTCSNGVGSDSMSAAADESEHGQMVNTINQTLRDDQDEDPFFRDIPPSPREIRPVPAQRRFLPSQLPPKPLPPKPKPRPLPPVPPPRHDVPSVKTPKAEQVESPSHISPAAPPPSPCPSTSTISVTTPTEKDRVKNTFDTLKAMWTLGRGSSPRVTRKQNPALTKRRQVSVKDVSPGDVVGVLWHRRRRGAATWTQGYFVLQGSAFYGFRNRERHRAHLFIFLPGFTCSVANEVKSRNHAFKIYHTGTVFYFAAESEEEMQQWLDGASLATTNQDENRSGETQGWSETDSESSDNESFTDSCFPAAPRMGRLLGTPARSQQNLSSDSPKCESPRKFHSLKKLGGKTIGGSSNQEVGSEAASLDRKYLRFLTQKNTPVPVPTSQFRSYRRMQQPAPPPRPPPRPPCPEESSRLSRRTLHSSNPSLVNEMADYRLTQERLREFRNMRSQEARNDREVDLSGFITLEQFMLSRQEEERNMRTARHTRTRVYPSEQRENVAERRDSQVSHRSSNDSRKFRMPASYASTSALSEEASSSGGSTFPDYPGIEYPPAFEPETYTLEYMINSRRRKDAKLK